MIFGIYILGGREFLFNADQRLQYNYFYDEWLRLIEKFITNGEFPFYSWNTFLGNNFYASKAYYVVGDIFLPFLFLMRSNLDVALMIESLTLIFLSGLFFSGYLNAYGFKNNNVILLLSLIYALSGTSTIFVGQYMFHRFYAFFPLLLWGIECYFNRNKKCLFIFSVFLLFITNYYLMFPTTLFLPLYFWHTWIRRYSFNIKKFFAKAFILVFYYFIGFFMGCIIVLPAILYMLGNSRLGEYNTWNNFWEFRVYMGFLFSYITPPATLYTTIPYIFVSGFNGHDYWYSIYASVLGCITLFSSLIFSNKKFRITTVIPYLILLTIAFYKPFNSVMHGLSQPSFRWSFLIFTFGLLMTGYVLEHIHDWTNKLIKGYAVYVILYIIYLVIGFMNKTVVLPDHNYHLLLSLIYLLVGGIYCIFIKKGLIKFLYFCVYLELCFSMTLTCWNLSKDYRSFIPSIDRNILKYWQDVDEDLMFRIYINPDELMPISDMNKNQSLPLGYMSTATYDSTYEPELTEYLKNNGINWHNVNLNSEEQLKSLGVKYILVKNQQELPQELSVTKAFDINEYQAWKLQDFKSIGLTYSSYVSENQVNPNHLASWDWDESLKDQMTSWTWSTTLIIPEILMNRVANSEEPQVSFTVTEKYNNGIKGYIEVVNEPSILYFSIPYSKGWKAVDNDNSIPIYKVNNGFIGMLLEPGYHQIQLNFTPYGFKGGSVLSLLGGLGFVIVILNEHKEIKSKTLKKFRKS